jgi:ankyrin repeat protein
LSPNSPLHEAARRLQIDVVDLLLKKGANVNAAGNQDYAPLHYVAQEDAPELALLLIQYGAQIEKRDRQGQTPLHWACRAAPTVAEILIQQGAEIDLNCAIRVGDVERVRRLINRKAGLTSLAAFPQELLVDAVFARNNEILELLLAHKKRPTPLELASPATLLFSSIQQAMSDSDTTIVRKLLEHGASTVAVNKRGESLLRFLSKFRAGVQRQAEAKRELICLLKDHGAQE